MAFIRSITLIYIYYGFLSIQITLLKAFTGKLIYGTFFSEISPAKRNDTAMIMYTSGTTGAAKGVILTNYNIVSSVAGLGAGIPFISPTDVYIGYLPLAHILEFAAEMTCLVFIHVLIYLPT